jgi:hypothetical protein
MLDFNRRSIREIRAQPPAFRNVSRLRLGWLGVHSQAKRGRDRRSAHFFASAQLKSKADFVPEKTGEKLDLNQCAIFPAGVISAHEKNS